MKRNTRNKAPRAIRVVLKNTRNKSQKANTSQSKVEEEAPSVKPIYATPLSKFLDHKLDNLASKQKQQFWLRTTTNKQKRFFVVRLRQNPCDSTLHARKHFNHKMRHKKISTFGTARRR